MNPAQQLFVIGPARSGTTYAMVQLNRSDDVFLFSELNSFQLPSGVDISADEKRGFAVAFNQRKQQESNTRQKGSFIPNADTIHSVEALYDSLAQSYRVVGEKVALGSTTTDGRYPAETLFDTQVSRHFNARHLLILRQPAEILDSMLLKFPDLPMADQFMGLVHSFTRLFELCWMLPRAKLAFYERLGDAAFAEVFAWLGLDWGKVGHVPFQPKVRADFSFRRAELRRQVPGLERLDHLYNDLLLRAGDQPLWCRQEEGDYRSSQAYELISAGLRGLLADCMHATATTAPSTVPALETSALNVVSPHFILQTNFPLAIDSVDHQAPLGTMQDNYRSPAFTRKLLDLYAGTEIAVLDLGCAGGGFVKEVTEFGHVAVGLEGSDYSQRHQRAEWATIPERLFTCDCTKPFALFLEQGGARQPATFHVVTAWEFLEHIPESQLPELLDNVKRHLHQNEGLFIASIHLRPCIVNSIEYHATVRPEWWWRALFMDHGLFPIDRALDYFDEDWVRGATPEQNALGSCHVVLSLNPTSAIVRRVDRVATLGLEHARLGRSEMKQMLIAAQTYTKKLERELAETRASLVAAARANPAYDISSLHRLAAQAITHCRLSGCSAIALYGTGNHTRQLLPIWRSLGGPDVMALITTKKTTNEFAETPVFELGEPLPVGVTAIVPSSHLYEGEMRRLARAAYPHLPWIFLWEPPTGPDSGQHSPACATSLHP